MVSALSTVTIKATFEYVYKNNIKETSLIYKDGDAKDALVKLHKEF